MYLKNKGKRTSKIGPEEMVVPGDGFANGCEGARVHGIEMNHLSCYMTVFV
jgi:hypothetical protein